MNRDDKLTTTENKLNKQATYAEQNAQTFNTSTNLNFKSQPRFFKIAITWEFTDNKVNKLTVNWTSTVQTNKLTIN